MHESLHNRRLSVGADERHRNGPWLSESLSPTVTTPLELRFRNRTDWHDGLNRYLLPLECAVADPQSFECHAVVARLREMVVAELRIDASRLSRRMKDIRKSDAEYVKILCQLAGRSRVQQGLNTATLEPGRWTVCDPTREYLIEMSRDTRVLLILVPRSHCTAWLPAVNALVGRSLTSSGPCSIALAALTELLRAASALDPHSEGTLHDLVLALFERALATELKARGLEALAEQAISLPHLHAYIFEHLADAALTVERVASAFGISRRSMYNVFQPSGITPHVYILGARLERARSLLSGTESRTLPVAHIARQCGFGDPAHFTRAFHARYGVAPTAWRAQAT